MRHMLQFPCEWKKVFFLCLKLMASQPSVTSSEVNEHPLEALLYLSLQPDFSRMPYDKKRGGSCAHKNHIGMYGMQEP